MGVAVETKSSSRTAALVDGLGRRIEYLRVSVTDRCNLRCLYCMPERMSFLPTTDVLGIPQIDRAVRLFVARGVRRVRITGGEPLVRPGVADLFESLGSLLRDGALEELTLTTNGLLLAGHVSLLARAGVRRVNVSLDTLDPTTFERITRRPGLERVLEGIEAAREAGLALKIDTVVLARHNLAELPALIEWAHARSIDVSLIEVMPMGEVDEDRFDQHVPMARVKRALAERWTLEASEHRTAGPSRYVRIRETGGRVGFITPLSEHFCDSCDRVRLSAAGKLHLCLGQEEHADLGPLLREGASDEAIFEALAHAIARKPRGHDFRIDRPRVKPVILRRMSSTGG